jgi:hypothetical protein
MTPFQKLDAPTSLQARILGLQALYIKSTKGFQIFSLSTEYLLIHDPRRHKFNSLR